MSPSIVLLVLRLMGAAILLAFLVAIIWLSYQDIKIAAGRSFEPKQASGRLHVIASQSSSPATGSEIPLLSVTSIGRSAANTIVLEDEYVSSEHALLSLRGQQWWLEDLGSRNGTLLNDLPVTTATVLSSGDVIAIGRTNLRLDL